MKKYYLLSLILLISTFLSAQSIKVTISNIRNTKGNILLSFYKHPDNFPYKPEMRKFIDKSNIKNQLIEVVYDGFEPGVYAMTLLDDENENEDMNYRFLIPQEGYGFSNYEHSGLTPPKFSDCSFEVKSDTTEVKIKIQYW
jgi:uncharacterized protein (DUF2141 family)